MRRALTLLVIGAAGLGVAGCGGSTAKHAASESASTTATGCTKFAAAIKVWVSTTKRADDEISSATAWHAALESIDTLQTDLAGLPSTVQKPAALEADLEGAHFFDYEMEMDDTAGHTAGRLEALEGAGSEALKVLKAYPKLIFGSCVKAAAEESVRGAR